MPIIEIMETPSHTYSATLRLVFPHPCGVPAVDKANVEAREAAAAFAAQRRLTEGFLADANNAANARTQALANAAAAGTDKPKGLRDAERAALAAADESRDDEQLASEAFTHKYRVAVATIEANREKLIKIADKNLRASAEAMAGYRAGLAQSVEAGRSAAGVLGMFARAKVQGTVFPQIAEPAGKKRQVESDLALEHLNGAIGLAIVEADQYKAELDV